MCIALILPLRILRLRIEKDDEEECRHFEATHPIDLPQKCPDATRPWPGYEYKSYHRSSCAVPTRYSTAARQDDQLRDGEKGEKDLKGSGDERINLVTQGAGMPDRVFRDSS